MNLNTLEKLARMLVSGGNIDEKSSEMMRRGELTRGEHNVLRSPKLTLAFAGPMDKPVQMAGLGGTSLWA